MGINMELLGFRKPRRMKRAGVRITRIIYEIGWWQNDFELQAIVASVAFDGDDEFPFSANLEFQDIEKIISELKKAGRNQDARKFQIALKWLGAEGDNRSIVYQAS